MICSACSSSAVQKKPVIKAVFSVDVTDPVLKEITGITSRADIDASGELQPGSYPINGRTLKVAPGTRFQLSFSLPVDNPSVLSTEKAEGKLWTSVPMALNDVPLPQTVEMSQGKATGDVNLTRFIGAFVLNIIEGQMQSKSDSDIHEIIQDLNIGHATLELKSGSMCRFGDKHLHIGDHSKIELKDVSVDSNFDYQGKCVTDLTFLKGCEWIGERGDCTFNGGSASLVLDATRQNGTITLSLPKDGADLMLTDCSYRFGKNKRSKAHADKCLPKLKQLIWQKKEGAVDADLHFTTDLSLNDVDVDVKTDHQETVAHFPGTVPADLRVDIKNRKRETHFSTEHAQTASNAHITINRPSTKLGLSLTHATIDPLSLDKFGDIEFSFAHGTADLKQLEWSSGTRDFNLVTSGASTITLPKGLDLSLGQGKTGSHLVLPISTNLGTATLEGGSNRLSVGDLNGNILVTVDGDAQINSDVDFSIERCKLLGTHRAMVRARGLEMRSSNGQARAHVKSCSVVLSEEGLLGTIQAQLPKETSFKINKVVMDRKWRYRNATVDTARVTNLSLDRIKHIASCTADCDVSGDVEVDGTVDKSGLFSVFSAHPKTQTCPWTARGKVNCTARISYKLTAGNSLANSNIVYKLAMPVHVPEDVDLDWSQVATGLLASAEKSVILKHLHNITVPINHDGVIDAFEDKNPWSAIKISNLTTKAVSTGTEVDFSADASF